MTGTIGRGSITSGGWTSTALWWATTINGKTTPFGDQTPTVVNLDPVIDRWPDGAVTNWFNELGKDLRSYPPVQVANSALQWLAARFGGLLQIVGGTIALLGGTAIALGGTPLSGGLSVIPGVGLMAMGVDDILMGVYNVSNPNLQSMSVTGYGFYSGAQGLGASEGISQAAAALGPLALSLGLGVWGGMARGAATAGEAGLALGAPTTFTGLAQFQALRFAGLGQLGWQATLGAWMSPSALFARFRLLFGSQFVIRGSTTVADAVPLLRRLTIMTGREVGLMRLPNGKLIIRLGSRNSVNAAGVIEVLAHTHPKGLLIPSADWLLEGGMLAQQTDTFVLRFLGQTSTYLIAPQGQIVRWFSPGGAWSENSLLFELFATLP